MQAWRVLKEELYAQRANGSLDDRSLGDIINRLARLAEDYAPVTLDEVFD